MKYQSRSVTAKFALALLQFWIRVLGKRGLIALTGASVVLAVILEQKL